MSHSGYEGWIAVYENVGGSLANPQALQVNAENLDFGYELRKRNFQVSDGRTTGTFAQVPISTKPKGTLNFQLHTDDCLKFMYSHFQNGSKSGIIGTRSYSFYPNRGVSRYRSNDRESYNFVPYTISVLKKLYDSGTNAFFFKNGITETLNLGLSTGQETALEASIRFLDVDYGTAVESAPEGSYSPHTAFESWSGTVKLDGQTIDLFSLSLSSTNKLQENLRLGASNPVGYRFMDYQLTGQMAFDLPSSSLDQVGSLFGTKNFSITATLFNSANDCIKLSLPLCRRLPFNYQQTGRTDSLKGAIPFEAFWSDSSPTIFEVDTSYEFTLVATIATILDANYGPRTIGTTWFIADAQYGTRSLGTYIFYDRDV